NGTFGMLNLPELSVAVFLSKPLTGLRRLTIASATTAPVGSVTVPTTEVEFPPDCAYRTRLRLKKIIAKVASSDFFEEASMIPPGKSWLQVESDAEVCLILLEPRVQEAGERKGRMVSDAASWIPALLWK